MNSLKIAYDAVRNGDVSVVDSILRMEPSLANAQTPFGTLLHVAAAEGNEGILNALLDSGAEVNALGGTFGGTALNQAAASGKLEAVRLLLSRGAKIDTSEPERNPLFGAIYASSIEIAKLLIDSGIDISIAYTGNSMKGMDAKAFAIERGENKIANLLHSQ